MKNLLHLFGFRFEREPGNWTWFGKSRLPDNSTQFSPIDSEYVKPAQFQCKPVVTMIIDKVMNIFPRSSEIWQRAGYSFNSHNRESRSVRQARVVYFKVA